MSLDSYLSPAIRQQIETQYYAKVNEQARLENLLLDPQFHEAPEDHIGLFSDHGVVHVRDVARQILEVLERVHGTLIPRRSPERFHLMKGIGVLLAYIHDIGMFDFSSFGRAIHPEFAAQAMFRPEMEPIVTAMWQENSGGLPALLMDWHRAGILTEEPQLVLRELLALAAGHSKSVVPVAVLADVHHLRTLMLEIVRLDLSTLYQRKRKSSKRQADFTTTDFTATDFREADASDQRRHDSVVSAGSFLWLVSDHPLLRGLTEDLIDCIRALRCADALRQRGAVLRTSGGYEIFMDQFSGRAVFALSLDDTRHFFLETPAPISAGEANIASSEVDGSCDLRISFHRGHFSNPGATESAAANAAYIVNDIQKDVIDSFTRNEYDERNAQLKSSTAMQIVLEETDDDPDFAALVQKHLMLLNPTMADRVQIAPSLHYASSLERDRYLAAPKLDWHLPQRLQVIQQIAASGYRTEMIDPEQAFNHVKLITLVQGEVLLEAGHPAAFVYVPLQAGLRVFPLGGYVALRAQPCVPLGVTGVIRGAVRNATIRAEETVSILMIPKMIYLKHWHHPHTPASFLAATILSVPSQQSHG